MPPEFGETPLLTEFDGPAENPLYDDGRWSSYWQRPPLMRRGDGFVHGTVEFAVNGSYWAQESFSGDYIEAWGCTPGSGLGAALESQRVLLLKDDPHGMTGYSSGWGGGIGNSYFFRKYVNGNFTALGEVGGGGPEKLGIRLTPTATEQWSFASGVWTLVQSSGDVSLRGGNWYAAIETEEQGGIEEVGFGCFGGGVPRRTQFFRWTRGYKEEVLA